MSAEVILMNQNGVAIAADSAVTIGNREKIYNTADKMFMLSKHAPIGILVYNNSSIMGIQMELIIKQYREKIQDKLFASLEEYCNDFINFCIEFCNKYSGEKVEEEIINDQIFNYCDSIFKGLSSIVRSEIGKGTIKNDNELKNFANKKIIEMAKKLASRPKKNSMEEDYYNRIILDLDTENIVKLCMNRYLIQLDADIISQMKAELHKMIKDVGYWDVSNFTGIAITGFGREEIFPGCIQIETLGIINNRLIEIGRNTSYITHDQKSQIFPLAQTDVMNEFFLGSNGEINNIYDRNFARCINAIKDESTKEIVNNLKQSIDNEKNSLISERLLGVHRSLSFLPRDEMIYMAEGMVNLTSFKRRLVLDNYSETVGGPIDVAFISKSDGFVWIKRKFYFDKDMNYVFFKNYFDKGIDNNEKN